MTQGTPPRTGQEIKGGKVGTTTVEVGGTVVAVNVPLLPPPSDALVNTVPTVVDTLVDVVDCTVETVGTATETQALRSEIQNTPAPGEGVEVTELPLVVLVKTDEFLFFLWSNQKKRGKKLRASVRRRRVDNDSRWTRWDHSVD